MSAWELTYLHADAMKMDALVAAANELGAQGWEPFAATSADWRNGANKQMLLFRRQVPPRAS